LSLPTLSTWLPPRRTGGKQDRGDTVIDITKVAVRRLSPKTLIVCVDRETDEPVGDPKREWRILVNRP
jgi:hypothetical protein